MERTLLCASAGVCLMKIVKDQSACAKLLIQVALLSPLSHLYPTARDHVLELHQPHEDNLIVRLFAILMATHFLASSRGRKAPCVSRLKPVWTKFSLFPSLAYTNTLLRAMCGETVNSGGHRLCPGEMFYVLKPRTSIAL